MKEQCNTGCGFCLVCSGWWKSGLDAECLVDQVAECPAQFWLKKESTQTDDTLHCSLLLSVIKKQI